MGKAKAFKEIESLADEYGKIAAGVGYVLDKSSTDNKLYELVEAGMPVAEAYAARLMYTQLSKDEELTPVERYEKFRVWVYGNDEWTDAEKTAVIERFGKFSSGFVAKSENFDEMIESGSIDADVANSINSGIRNLEPEDGKDDASVYQKYDYILSREDLSPSQKDAAIIAYMGEQEETRFKPCADSGVSATTYANVALRIHELKPTGGRPSVNDGQKFEVCVNAVSSEKQQDALLNRYMDSNQSAKYEKARSAGITPTLYVKYYNAKYTYGDGNGSWTQDELQRWLDANVSSRSQKDTLWELTNSGWKNNPYK